MGKLTLNVDALTVTTFEPATAAASNNAVAATLATTVACCGGGCNTRLTCSTNLC